MSLIHIRQQGHSIHIFDGIIEIKRASNHAVVMTGVEEGTLLKLNGTSSTNSCESSALLVQQSDILSLSLLWYAQFGHINYGTIRVMKNKGIKGLPTILRKITPCDACILGKHCKQHFHSSFRASRKLGLIHSNLCGPIPISTANGNKYVLTFIDDYSRMGWVYLLNDKSHVFEVFKTFHLMIKNETQQNIGILITDNWLVYFSCF